MKFFHRTASAATALLALSLLMATSGCNAGPPPQQEKGATATPDATKPADYRTLGPADAPLTIVEFTDLQCPYCARFASETFPELRARYIDTGKVRFTTRDLPLPMHEYAV